MEPEYPLTLIELITEFNNYGVRYVLIGRRAVILYGGPVITKDYDFIINSDDRNKVYEILEDKYEFEMSKDRNEKAPIVVANYGLMKVDLHFSKSISNSEGEKIDIDYDEVYKNSVILTDEETNLSIRVPCVDDLIKLKKIRPFNTKDNEDIKYLLLYKKSIEEQSKKN